MNPIAKDLNQIIQAANPHIVEMLSAKGRSLYFPKGILSQSAEAKQKAHKINATIGIATEKGQTMHFPSVMEAICGIRPEASLTYAPSFGIPELRKAWHAALNAKNPSLAGKSYSLPVVTCGITHAISMFADMWTDPGDVVLVPDMIWGNYNLIFSVKNGVTLRHFEMFDDRGGFNLAALEDALKTEAARSGKIVVLLNFPNNPTGYTVTKAEGDRIVEILSARAEAGSNVIAVTDDAYFGLFYEDDLLKESLFAHLCDRHPRLLAVKLDGATKENFVWGLRIGFITYGGCLKADPRPVYDALEKKTAGCIRGSISNASHLGQSIVLRSMQAENFGEEKEEKFEVLKRRAQRVKEVLANPKYQDAWDVYPFNSGYFMCVRLKSVDAETLRTHLLAKYGVGLISIGDRNIRVAFSCLEEEQIPELFDIVLQGVADLET